MFLLNFTLFLSNVFVYMKADTHIEIAVQHINVLYAVKQFLGILTLIFLN